jgi:hypothetical protein
MPLLVSGTNVTRGVLSGSRIGLFISYAEILLLGLCLHAIL